MPIFISDTPVRRDTMITTGTSSTTPTSKNSGRPRIAAIAAIIQGSPLGPTLPTSVPTIRLAPPESSRIFPIIAPSAIRTPTAPVVDPKPVTKLVTMSPGGIVATAPSTAEPSMRDRNGCTFAQVMSRTTARMPRTHAATSWPLPAAATGASARWTAVRGTALIGRGPSGVRGRCRARSRTWAAVPSLVTSTPGSSASSGSSVASWLGSSDAGM